MKYILILILAIAANSCNPNLTNEGNKQEVKDTPIAQYVANVYENTKGNLWLGPLQKGVARYDGNALRYFTTNDGLPSDRGPSYQVARDTEV